MNIKGQGHSLTFAKGHSVFKLTGKSFFFLSKTVELFETKYWYHVKDFGSTKMKIYTNGLGLMTKMAATPIYGKKKPAKSFFSKISWPIAMKLGM